MLESGNVVGRGVYGRQTSSLAQGKQKLRFAHGRYMGNVEMGGKEPWAMLSAVQAVVLWTASAIKNEVVDPSVTFEDFLEEIRVHAVNKNSVMSKRAYKQWCVKYGLEE